MAEYVPYLSGMTLGRTYDLSNHTLGLNIFSSECISNPQTDECPSTRIKYQVIKNSSDVNDLLDVSGDISLKVKAGILNVHGMGSYLKECRSKENAMEIVAVAHVETLSTTLINPKPVQNWNKNNKCTHYIHSVIYGGELLICINIKASDCKKIEEIKANVEADLQVHGVLDAKGKANFRKMEQDLKESSEINFTLCCTTPGIELPRDVDGMLKALDDFQNKLMTTKEGRGTPIRCELVPLTDLDPEFPAVLRQTGLETQMRELGDEYDDIRLAKSMLQTFLLDTAEHMTKEQEEKGTEIEKRIRKVKSIFDKVISTLDVTTAGDSLEQIQKAVDYYHENKKIGGFRIEVKKFLNDVQRRASTGASGTPMRDLPPGDSLSILLVGKTGHGKSATANSIFGERRFHSDMASDSVSIRCQMETGTIGGRKVCLVDTPGTMDTKHPKEALQELGTAIALRPEGFHAFMFVVNIDVRITDEEKTAIQVLKSTFGEDILAKYGIFIFTHGDSFKKNMKMHKGETTFLEYLESQGGYLAIVLKECNFRCALIDNLEEDRGILRDQVINIITLIDELVANNNGKTYTNYLFKLAQEKLEEEKKRIHEEKVQRKIEKDKVMATKIKKAVENAEAKANVKVKSKIAPHEVVGRQIGDTLWRKMFGNCTVL